MKCKKYGISQRWYVTKQEMSQNIKCNFVVEILQNMKCAKH